MTKDILIVDDEEDIRTLISGILEDQGYNSRSAWDLISLKQELSKRIPSLVLLDVWLEKSSVDGLDLLKLIKKSYRDIPVIMISGHGNINMALKAIKVGAFNFIEKPFETNILLLNIKRAIELTELRKKTSENKSNFDDAVIGFSQLSQNLKNIINKVANTKSRVMIYGPSGSGKKFSAEFIHKLSSRSNGPLMLANTKRYLPNIIEEELFGQEDDEGIITKIGIVEQAHTGTLYIDEITNLSDKVQSRLIKLLTENSFTRLNGKYSINVDVRIIAGTSKNLLQEIENKKFREDLYYRLNVVPINIPSLEDRIEDIPLFADYFLKVCSANLGVPLRKISKEGYNVLQSKKWDGNLRQLKNSIEQILIMDNGNLNDPISIETILNEKADIDNGFKEVVQKKMLSLSLKKAREYFEIEYIKLQMSRFNNNVSKTAEFIGMERSALHRKLKTLNIKEN